MIWTTNSTMEKNPFSTSCQMCTQKIQTRIGSEKGETAQRKKQYFLLLLMLVHVCEIEEKKERRMACDIDSGYICATETFQSTNENQHMNLSNVSFYDCDSDWIQLQMRLETLILHLCFILIQWIQFFCSEYTFEMDRKNIVSVWAQELKKKL